MYINDFWPGGRREQLFLLNLTSDDPETVLKGQERAWSINNGMKWCTQGCKIKKFMEAKQGLCIFQVEDSSNSDSSDSFIVEVLAWKGETLPKALNAWSRMAHSVTKKRYRNIGNDTWHMQPVTD